MQGVRPTAGLLLLFVCLLLCTSCGPHMNKQPSIKPFEKEMPAIPAGTVSTRGTIRTLTLQQAALKASPISATKVNISNGKIFYGYYCSMCHGENGAGNGPVGQSYVPKPTDLSSPRLARFTDGQLYYRMLTGIGHSPELIPTVHPSERWPLVLYVRTFAKGASKTPTTP